MGCKATSAAIALLAMACGGAAEPEAQTEPLGPAPSLAIKVSSYPGVLNPIEGGLHARVLIPLAAESVLDARAIREQVTKIAGQMRNTRSALQFFGCRTAIMPRDADTAEVSVTCPDAARPTSYGLWVGEPISLQVLSTTLGDGAAVSRGYTTSLIRRPWGFHAVLNVPVHAGEIASLHAYRRVYPTFTSPKADLAAYGCHVSVASGLWLPSARIELLCRDVDRPARLSLTDGDTVELKFLMTDPDPSVDARTYLTSLSATPWGAIGQISIDAPIDALHDVRLHVKMETSGQPTQRIALVNLGCETSLSPLARTRTQLRVTCPTIDADGASLGGRSITALIVIDMQAVNFALPAAQRQGRTLHPSDRFAW